MTNGTSADSTTVQIPPPPDNALTFDFLPVGQGDGTLITCPSGERILVDLGSLEGWNKYTYKNTGNGVNNGDEIIEYIFRCIHSNGDKLNYLILTHPDRDHYNKLEALFTKIRNNNGALSKVVEKVIISGHRKDYKSEDDNRNILWTKYGIPPKLTCTPGVSGPDDPVRAFYEKPTQANRLITCDKIEIWILTVNYPAQAAKDLKPEHLRSMVLLFKYGDKKVILSGDTHILPTSVIMSNYTSEFGPEQGPGQAREQAQKFLGCAAQKIPHHGGKLTDDEIDGLKKWLQFTKPHFVFISAGTDLSYGHPRLKTTEAILTAEPKFLHNWRNHKIVAYSERDSGWFKYPPKAEGLFTSLTDVDYEKKNGLVSELTHWRLIVKEEETKIEIASRWVRSEPKPL